MFDNILSDKGIEQALDKGLIKIDKNIKDDQLQPASLDVRIGSVRIWDDEAKRKEGEYFEIQQKKGNLDLEPGIKFSKFIEYEEGKAFDVPPNAHIEIRILEDIKFDYEDIFAFYDLKSSRGRMSFLNYTVPMLDKDEKGYYISLINKNPNPVRLYCGDKFAQLFFSLNNKDLMNKFYHGRLIRDEKEFEEVKNFIKEIYMRKADDFFQKGQKNKALESYERVLSFVTKAEDEIEIKLKLLGLYKSAGKMQDYALMKAQFEK